MRNKQTTIAGLKQSEKENRFESIKGHVLETRSSDKSRIDETCLTRTQTEFRKAKVKKLGSKHTW